MRDLSKVVGDTWRGLRPKEREHYEQKARKETARYLSERRQFDDLQRMFTEMHSSAFHAGTLYMSIMLSDVWIHTVHHYSRPLPPPQPPSPLYEDGNDSCRMCLLTRLVLG